MMISTFHRGWTAAHCLDAEHQWIDARPKPHGKHNKKVQIDPGYLVADGA